MGGNISISMFGRRSKRYKEFDAIPCRKVVLVGDATVGKTCLASKWANGEFLQDSYSTSDGYVITSNSNHFKKDLVLNQGDKQKQFTLDLYDTSGDADYYDTYGKKVLPSTDGVIMCFSVNSRSSFENLDEIWIDEVKKFCPRAPVLLVGTKSDLRSTENELSFMNTSFSAVTSNSFVSKEEAEKFLSKFSLSLGYMECSSLTGEGVNKVFYKIAEETFKRKSFFQRSKRYKFKKGGF